MAGTLGVDVGKGACRARWTDAAADHGFGVGPGVPHIAEPGAPEAIVAAIVAAADDAGAPGNGIHTVCAGVTGLSEADHLSRHLARLVLDALGARCAVVTGDVVTSHAGALDGGAGVVVAAGTGSVALGVDPNGRHAKVDGLGYIVGDQGSGFAVGRRGLASALRSFDGRGGSEALGARAEQLYGPLGDLPAAVYASDNPPAFVARFAPSVAEAARAGDADAVAIWRDVADQLAVTAAAALDRLDWTDGAVPLSWTGKLFDAGDVLWEHLTSSLAARAPRLTLQAPRGDSLSGALLLARLGGAALHRGLLHAEHR